jgi:phospholipid-binding lipoprotein MlaA
MNVPRFLLLFAMLLPGLAWSGMSWADEHDDNIDPWEPFNRKIFAFNDKLDQYVLLPVAKGYRYVMPDPAEQGVSNFISNIYEFNTVINSLLQGRPGNALESAARFLVNSTVGLAGLIDAATPMGLENKPADFDQTLYTWGVDAGPYLVLPLYGPHTVRSSVGYLADTYSSIPALIDDPSYAYPFWALEAIDVRAELIKADDLVTGDRYIFIRNAYLQRREYFLHGEVKDSFSEPAEGDEYEEF